jgi:hypothetical protein
MSMQTNLTYRAHDILSVTFSKLLLQKTNGRTRLFGNRNRIHFHHAKFVNKNDFAKNVEPVLKCLLFIEILIA